ncbi:MAG: hypothetical protein AAGA10_07100 [Bacteroidota bacterium]
MPSKPSSDLLFLERQFNSIKLLIPEVNLCMSRASAPGKLMKNYFQQYARDWDHLKSGSYANIWPGELSEREVHFLYRKLLGVMKLLILLKRISKEALDSQKLHKAAIYQLLGRLSDQVLRENPSKPLPSFSQKEIGFSPKRNLLRPKGLWEKTKPDKNLQKLHKRLAGPSYHAFFIKISQTMLKDLNHLHQLGLVEEKDLGKSKKIYLQKEAKAEKAKKEFEAKALNTLSSMYSVQLELSANLRKEVEPIYDGFIRDLDSLLDT